MSTKTAKADVAPVRQRTQYTCMSTSMMMCLRALGHEVTEDEVNKVIGARPMQGASWEQALACAQHYGCRATLTMPSTVAQLKEWTDRGVPVMIAWNPEGRPWSHASVVFDVDDEGNVHVADPNIPDPDETIRIVPKVEFYGKWAEKWPSYQVRRPACAIEREITMDGQQVPPVTPTLKQAMRREASRLRVAAGYDQHTTMPRLLERGGANGNTNSISEGSDQWLSLIGGRPKIISNPTHEVTMSRNAKKKPKTAPKTQKERDQGKNKAQGELPKQRNEVVQGLIERGQGGAGGHKNKGERGQGGKGKGKGQRHPKHKNKGYQAGMAELERMATRIPDVEGILTDMFREQATAVYQTGGRAPYWVLNPLPIPMVQARLDKQFGKGSFLAQASSMGTRIDVGKARMAGYKGNPGGKDIYPSEIEHGYGEPVGGGTDVMRKLQNQLLDEQGNTKWMRPDSPKHGGNDMQRKAGRPLKPGEAQVDDLVKWTSKFLRNTGQYVGAPIDGKVMSLIESGSWAGWPRVQWSDSTEVTAVNPANLELTRVSRRAEMVELERMACGCGGGNDMQRKAGRPLKPGEAQVDDLVKWTSKFLRNTGQYVGAPIDGKVMSLIESGSWAGWPRVQWSDSTEVTAVNPANLELTRVSRRAEMVELERMACGCGGGGVLGMDEDGMPSDHDHHELERMAGRVAMRSATIEAFLLSLRGGLIRYDQSLARREQKHGGTENIYRLGHFMAALAKARDRVSGVLTEDSPEAMEQLKAALAKSFTHHGGRFDAPPLRALVKKMDAWTTGGKMPRYGSINQEGPGQTLYSVSYSINEMFTDQENVWARSDRDAEEIARKHLGERGLRIINVWRADNHTVFRGEGRNNPVRLAARPEDKQTSEVEPERADGNGEEPEGSDVPGDGDKRASGHSLFGVVKGSVMVAASEAARTAIRLATDNHGTVVELINVPERVAVQFVDVGTPAATLDGKAAFRLAQQYMAQAKMAAQVPKTVSDWINWEE